MLIRIDGNVFITANSQYLFKLFILFNVKMHFACNYITWHTSVAKS